MRKSILFKGLLLATGLPLLAGCIVERHPRRVVVVEQPAQTGDVVVAQPENPPPPQVEAVPAAPGPLRVWFWVPGCWEWRGHWVWVGGHWLRRPHRHAVWVAPHWEHRGRGYIWIGGYWR